MRIYLPLCFLPSFCYGFVVQQPGSAFRASALSATVEDTTAAPPVKEAPGAGWVPDWEDRKGLPESEFMKSDENQPDLSGMWECPLTRWDSEGYGRMSAVFRRREHLILGCAASDMYIRRSH